jgi:hypothetical protein
MWQFQWILSLIPDSIFVWITYFLMAIGSGLYIASKLVKWIPLMGQYKLPAELIGIIVLLAGTYLFGGYGVEMAWRERVAELEAKVKEAEVQSQKVNIVIQTKIVERVKIVEKKVEVVRKEIEVQKEVINAECKINDVAIELYNKAISDPLEVKQ